MNYWIEGCVIFSVQTFRWFGGLLSKQVFFKKTKQRIFQVFKNRLKKNWETKSLYRAWFIHGFHSKMSAKLNQIRDQALAIVFTEFEEEKLCKSVKSFEESDVTDDDIQCVKDKYRNAFKNYFTTAFDIAFQKDLVAKLKENGTSESDQRYVSFKICHLW